MQAPATPGASPAEPATIAEALDGAVTRAGGGTVVAPPALDGFPGTAHGGAVAALVHRLVLPRPPWSIRLRLLHGVPTGQALRLLTSASGAEARVTLSDGSRTLAEAAVRREGLPRPEPESLHPVWAALRTEGDTVPFTRTCLACGSGNPLGLQLQLRFDARFVWQEVLPRPPYRGEHQTHPAFATVALDELAWWLGALAQRECGVTTEVAITLLADLPALGTLLLVGDRAVVRGDDDPRGRFVRVAGQILDPGGRVLATADVRYAGSRVYTRRLLDPFLATTPRDRLALCFPGVATLAGRREDR